MGISSYIHRRKRVNEATSTDYWKNIVDNGEPNPTDLSEINAVALMIAHGASYVERVRKANSNQLDSLKISMLVDTHGT